MGLLLHTSDKTLRFNLISVPVVKKTWARETENLEYLSETEDGSIPTVKLDAPNTESGKQPLLSSSIFWS